MEANSFSYGRGNGAHPCTCSCYSDECSSDSLFDLDNDHFNIEESKKIVSKTKTSLSGHISDIDSLGLLTITFNNKLDVELLKSVGGRYIISNKMLDIYIEPFKERFKEESFNIS